MKDTKYQPVLFSPEPPRSNSGKKVSLFVVVAALLAVTGYFNGFLDPFLVSKEASDPLGDRVCKSITVRKEWRTLKPAEQEDYISAVKCLATKPSSIAASPVPRLYDDFAWTHSAMSHHIHFVAMFLPWHRWFVHVYEQRLRNECGYSGHAVWWNWTADADQGIYKSNIWSPDPRTGFGGNGTKDYPDQTELPDRGGAVHDGGFADFKLYWPVEHMLERHWLYDPTAVLGGVHCGPYGQECYNHAAMEDLLSKPWHDFHVSFEGDSFYMVHPNRWGAHGMIHAIIGGDMAGDFRNQNYAANDPLFYVHHGTVDRVWWQWQNRHDPERKVFYGNAIQNETDNGATLDLLMPFNGLSADLPVRNVMETTDWPMCYTY